MSAGAMRAAVPCVAVASGRGDSISNSRNSVATAPVRGRPGRRDVLPQPRGAPRDTATVGTPHGLESFDRHFSDLMNGAPQPSRSPRLAEHEEDSPYYGVDDDDEDDDEDEENPLVFRATATVALGAWFAYTRKKKADEERRLGKTKPDAETTESKIASNPVSKFVDTVRSDVASITAKSDDGKTPKQRYRERRAAERAAAEAREAELEKARLVRREELSKAAERETRAAAQERAERAKDALAREAERERMVSEARAKAARQEVQREVEARRASEMKAKLASMSPDEKKKAQSKEAAAKAKAAAKAETAKKAEAQAKAAAEAREAKERAAEGARARERRAKEAAKKAEEKAKVDAATKAKVAAAKSKAEAEAAAEKAKMAAERSEKNAAAQAAREKAKKERVGSNTAKGEEAARRKAALEAKAQETAAAAKQKLKAAEMDAKAAQERAAKEKKEADAASKREAKAKAQRDAKLAKEKAMLAETKTKAAKAAKAETAKSAKGKSSGKETAKVSSSAFRTAVSEKAAVASQKLEGLRSSLPTPEDARGLVTAARRKANAATVAVDASPNPHVATAAAYLGVKPSALIGGGLMLAAAALSAYAGKGGGTREDAGYAAFDREAGRINRGRDGGRAGRERQRAFLEAQLAADRDAQRARWRSAMDDGSDGSDGASDGSDASTSSATAQTAEATANVGAGARMREMFGLGDAAKRADGETSGVSETAAEDERRRLERIREMNRASGDVTAAAEAKLREARDKSKNGAGRGGDTADAAPPGATATVSAADVRRAEQKARAEAAVLSEYQTGEDDGDAGWDAKEVEEMSKKYEAFLKASKAKKWWSRGD